MKNKNEILVDGTKYLVNPETKEATILKVRAPKPKKGDIQGLFVVPDEVDGYKVTTVGECAFSDCKWVEEIIFGKNIREIDRWACSWHEKLLEIRFKVKDVDDVPIIREDAFLGCDNLRMIILAGFENRNYMLRRSTKWYPASKKDKEVLYGFMQKVESGAFALCYKVPVELEEH